MEINPPPFACFEKEFSAATLEAQYSPIAILWFQRDGYVKRFNLAACELLGYSSEELQRISIFDLDPRLTPDLWPDFWQQIHYLRTTKFKTRALNKSGQLMPVEVTVHHVEVGNEAYHLCFVQDLTIIRQTEMALRETQERYELVIQAANDGIWDWDLQTNEMYFSDRWHAILGFAPREIGATVDDWFALTHPDDLDRFQQKLNHYRSGKLEHLELELRLRRKSGDYCWVLCRGMALNDFVHQVYRIAGSITDITDRKKAQAQLIYDALHDPLTGLPNRNLLLDRLEQAIRHCKRSPQERFAVLFCDLDRFKLINDSLGHQAGDQMLTEIARRLLQCVRPDDTVARLGGDEFIVLLLNIDQHDNLQDVVKRIHQSISAPVHLDEKVIYPGVSIGLTLSESGSDSAEDYLRRADIAMYQAKESTQVNYAFFTNEMQATVVNRLQLEIDLQRVIERDELRLYYQPIMSLESRDIIGFEALLRWQHPKLGLLGPDQFIPIAEENGSVVSIGGWVLREACTQMRDWLDTMGHPLLFMSVNLSSQQVMQSTFVEEVLQSLAMTGLEPNCLKIEITESTIIHNTDWVREQLSALKKHRIWVAMDDFGTGYSSLSYLHQLPIDCIKIDQSFVQQIQTPQDSPEIIRAILAIARSLNMEVIAEGIATEKQADLLNSIGCSYGQGYYFSQPLPQQEATAFLTQMRQTLAG